MTPEQLDATQDGEAELHAGIECPDCDGLGAGWVGVRATYEPCLTCQGRGRVPVRVCFVCAGRGYLETWLGASPCYCCRGTGKAGAG